MYWLCTSASLSSPVSVELAFVEYLNTESRSEKEECKLYNQKEGGEEPQRLCSERPTAWQPKAITEFVLLLLLLLLLLLPLVVFCTTVVLAFSALAVLVVVLVLVLMVVVAAEDVVSKNAVEAEDFPNIGFKYCLHLESLEFT